MTLNELIDSKSATWDDAGVRAVLAEALKAISALEKRVAELERAREGDLEVARGDDN